MQSPEGKLETPKLILAQVYGMLDRLKMQELNDFGATLQRVKQELGMMQDGVEELRETLEEGVSSHFHAAATASSKLLKCCLILTKVCDVFSLSVFLHRCLDHSFSQWLLCRDQIPP